MTIDTQRKDIYEYINSNTYICQDVESKFLLQCRTIKGSVILINFYSNYIVE